MAWHHPPMLRPLLVLLLLIGLPRACWAQAEEQWFRVLLDGRAIGHMHSLREVADERVHSRVRMALVLRRGNELLSVKTDEAAVETPHGAPLEFDSVLEVSGSRSSVSGTVDADGTVRAEVHLAGKTHTRELRWPPGALLSEGQRLALLAQGWTPGPRPTLLSFDVASLSALPLATEVLGEETVELNGRTERLIRVRQTMSQQGSTLETTSWLEPANAQPRRLRMPALGLILEVAACDGRCDAAPAEPTDVLAATLLPSPRVLGVDERLSPLRYRLRLAGASPDALSAVPGQYLSAQGSPATELVVDPAGAALPAPTANDLAAARWLQVDDPKLQQLARDAVGRQRQPARRMALLERFVREHISTKSLRIGYASASEVIDLREGDCTEHAVLLAALARALGIPARVANGLAYTPGFNGQRDVFVPHAWVMAFVDGRWQGYDAALPRFDAGHIAFTVGDGDPLTFYAGVELLGRLRIEAIEPVRARDWRRERAALVRAEGRTAP